MIAFWDIVRVALKYTNASDAARTSETLVYFNETTGHYIPEGFFMFTPAAMRTWNLVY
jgi:hypothetical protein